MTLVQREDHANGRRAPDRVLDTVVVRHAEIVYRDETQWVVEVIRNPASSSASTSSRRTRRRSTCSAGSSRSATSRDER